MGCGALVVVVRAGQGSAVMVQHGITSRIDPPAITGLALAWLLGAESEMELEVE